MLSSVGGKGNCNYLKQVKQKNVRVETRIHRLWSQPLTNKGNKGEAGAVSGQSQREREGERLSDRRPRQNTSLDRLIIVCC